MVSINDQFNPCSEITDQGSNPASNSEIFRNSEMNTIPQHKLNCSFVGLEKENVSKLLSSTNLEDYETEILTDSNVLSFDQDGSLLNRINIEEPCDSSNSIKSFELEEQQEESNVQINPHPTSDEHDNIDVFPRLDQLKKILSSIAAMAEISSLKARLSINARGTDILRSKLESNCWGIVCAKMHCQTNGSTIVPEGYAIAAWNGYFGIASYVKQDVIMALTNIIHSSLQSISKKKQYKDVSEGCGSFWRMVRRSNHSILNEFLQRDNHTDYLLYNRGTLYTQNDIRLNDKTQRLIYCGSFNPLHKGHLELSKVAIQFANKSLQGTDSLNQSDKNVELLFEISLVNADKNPLSKVSEILSRLDQFKNSDQMVVLTKAPLFSQKSRILSHSTFVVGIDTIVRILDPKYYNNSSELLHNVLENMRQNGTQFIVAGRVDSGNNFITLRDVLIPDGFEDMFHGFSETDFRMDISSTELRRMKGL